MSKGNPLSVGNPAEKNIPGYYKGVLENHDLTIEQFDTIRKWYAAHPYHYQKVYDQVITHLNTRDAKLERKIKEERARKDTLPKIVDLWDEKRTLSVAPKDTVDSRLPFDLAIDSIEDGEIRLSAMYKFLREDMTREGRMQLIVWYNDTIADTVSHALEKTFQPLNTTLSAEIDSTMPAIRVSGFLFDHDTASATAIEFSRIRMEHVSEKLKTEQEEGKTPAVPKSELPVR